MPLPAVPAALGRIAAAAPGCRLTDVVSVKSPVRDAVRAHAPLARFVGGHPMAGTAESGWAAGSATLFAGASWVVALGDRGDGGTDREVWDDVAELAWDCGARVVPAEASEHDAAVARISQLPHLLAAVLAAVAAGDPRAVFAEPGAGALALALSAGSFADATRVADTRPELVLAMCEGNRSALLAALDDTLGRLGAARGSLASTGGLAATVNAGHRARQRWHEARATAAVRVPRSVSTEELRALGAAGRALLGWAD
jgi:prephenate dehydrogenase